MVIAITGIIGMRRTATATTRHSPTITVVITREAVAMLGQRTVDREIMATGSPVSASMMARPENTRMPIANILAVVPDLGLTGLAPTGRAVLAISTPATALLRRRLRRDALQISSGSWITSSASSRNYGKR